jgi:hypothetical protein
LKDQETSLNFEEPVVQDPLWGLEGQETFQEYDPQILEELDFQETRPESVDQEILLNLEEPVFRDPLSELEGQGTSLEFDL